MPTSFEIDLTRPTGQVRRLHGGGLGPTFSRAKVQERTSAHLRELGLPLIRLHDAPYGENGAKLVDIPQVFPLFHLDPADPRNYFFAHTDDYIASILNLGAKILFRLGVSIEHSARTYFTDPPADYDHWTDICIGIIRHYNEGWADGFHHHIEYWEIWNEPNLGPMMWTGSWEAYIRLYITAARKIKTRFPKIKIGGPALAQIRGFMDVEKIESLLQACRRENAPLDFFSWHNYTTDPAVIIGDPQTMRDILDRNGFKQTELHLNEWHHRWGTPDLMNHIEHAVFLSSVLAGWQDTPLDMGNYYSTHSGRFGVFETDGTPNKCFHAMKAFNLFSGYHNRVQVKPIDGVADVRVLAGRDNLGGAACFAACFKSGAGPLELRFRGLSGSPQKPAVRVLDAEHDLDPVVDCTFADDTLTLRRPRESVLYLIEFSGQASRPDTRIALGPEQDDGGEFGDMHATFR